MAVGDDFKVARRYRDEISEEAGRWRDVAAPSSSSNNFDIVRFLLDKVLPTLQAKGRHIELEIVPDDWTEPDAWVDFGTDKLCVQQFIWDLALEQHERGRLVIAHEIGHLVLHGEQIHAFSRGQEKKLNFLDATESAECQANWFASALLLPDAVLLRLSRVDDLTVAALALVSKRVVQVRRQEMAMDKRYRHYTGGQCSRCGSMRVKNVDADLVCEDCGKADRFTYSVGAGNPSH